MSKGASSLPAFSFNWVGGDIHGISNLAGVLYGFAGKSEEPALALGRVVDRLVGESGEVVYRGSAADRFKSSVEPNIVDLGWLSSRTTSMGDIVDELALRLAKIESWLESRAEQGVKAKYITIDGAGKLGLPAGSSDPQVQKFLQQFSQERAEALKAAKSARAVAARKLGSEYKALSAGLRNYRDNHKNLLSDNELKAIDSSMRGLKSSFDAADKIVTDNGVKLHWGAAVGGAWKGAAEVGGTIGVFGIETGPFDIPMTAVGATIGGVGGFFKGLVTGHALFEK
ncbi:hypothetical protein GCM10027176_78610 [Actinoallomurus bryophytorum]|uniref:Uncharacterized protein n=1 Tax=Actinoallomurus bryophytorum TaxID=1490222 RepID=A0A543CFM1_9ACTN|nr:hypothetical protein [Actinoallomurus bryophytorum]TQL95899.1 hypothetical protein FB559_1411 [Actinoallomurus bryophytorum]